jgi:hypothetical protein
MYLNTHWLTHNELIKTLMAKHLGGGCGYPSPCDMVVCPNSRVCGDDPIPQCILDCHHGVCHNCGVLHHRKVLNISEDTTECPICFEDGSTAKVRLETCGHSLCVECFRIVHYGERRFPLPQYLDKYNAWVRAINDATDLDEMIDTETLMGIAIPLLPVDVLLDVMLMKLFWRFYDYADDYEGADGEFNVGGDQRCPICRTSTYEPW